MELCGEMGTTPLFLTCTMAPYPKIILICYRIKRRLGISAPVCAFWRKEYISNFGSKKKILYVEQVSVEQKETTRETKLSKHETLFNVH